jgi:hypothetical protein
MVTRRLRNKTWAKQKLKTHKTAMNSGLTDHRSNTECGTNKLYILFATLN